MSVLQPFVPILSLPAVVLFPHAFMHLRLGEDQLDPAMGEWLADGAIWGVATMRTDGTEEAEFNPAEPVFRTVGLGCIVHRERENGCVRQLILEGMARGRIVDGYSIESGPTVQVEILRDHVNVDGWHRKELAHTFAEMVRAARRVAAIEPSLRDPIRRVLAAHPHPGVVADLLAHYCLSDVYAKQSILAEIDVWRRVRLVQIQMAQLVSRPMLHAFRRFR